MLHYGLDIHRRFTNYCVVDGSGVILTEGRCATDELARHPAFSLKWKKEAVLEAGSTWHLVFDMLEPLVDEVLLAHPLRVGAIAAARVKTDAIDARTLAHLLRSDLIPAAYVPPPKVREARSCADPDVLLASSSDLLAGLMLERRRSGERSECGLLDQDPEQRRPGRGSPRP